MLLTECFEAHDLSLKERPETSSVTSISSVICWQSFTMVNLVIYFILFNYSLTPFT